MHKANGWQNLCRRFFILGIIKCTHSTNMIYSVDIIWGRVFYKNPCLKGDNYTCELPNPLGSYITPLFVDHLPNKPPSLEHITTFYACKHYYPSNRLE